MTDVRDLRVGWMKDPAYRGEYDALEAEFAIASALIRARADAGLTQEELVERMGTKQEVIARRESGKILPSTRTLARLAKATGTRLQISFAPAGAGAEGTKAQSAAFRLLRAGALERSGSPNRFHPSSGGPSPRLK